MIALSMQSDTARDLALVEVPMPEPGTDEVRIEVAAAGICGSDVSAALAKPNFDWVRRPRILGHELSGVVDAAGAAVRGLEPGSRVTAVSVQGCGGCSYCRAGHTQLCGERTILGMSSDGAMASYCVVKAEHVVPLDEGLSHLQGALVEPLAVSARCMYNCCEVRAGDRVVVSGCGIIGLLCALVARARGAEVAITGIDADREVRLQMARALGFTTIVVSDHTPLVAQLAAPADILVEASGAPGALAAAPAAVARCGLIGVVATYPSEVAISATDLVRCEQRLHTSFGSTKADYRTAMAHLAAGDIPVDQLVETFPLTEALAALDASIEKRTPKAVIVP